MLKRCRLCARQLGSTRSLVLSGRHRPQGGENYQQQQQQQEQQPPIASTSKHVFETATWSSTLPRCMQRRRNSSATALSSIAGASTSAETDNRYEHDFSRSNNNQTLQNSKTSSSLWKGKARAVEPDSDALDTQQQHTQTKVNLVQPHTKILQEATQNSASASQPSTSSQIALEAQSSQPPQRLDTLLEQQDFNASFDAIVSDYLLGLEHNSPQSRQDFQSSIHRLQETFQGQPRTNAFDDLLEICKASSSALPPVESLVPLVFRAVLDHDEYRQHKARLQHLLKRALSYLLKDSLTRANALLTSILLDFKKRRRWESVEQLSRLGLTMFGTWTHNALEHYLEAIDRLDRHQFTPTISSFPSELLPLPPHLYDHLLRNHLTNRNLDAAQEVSTSMSAANLPFTQRTAKFMYSGYRQLGGYAAFLHDMHRLGLSSDTDMLNAVLESVLQTEGVPAAVQAIEALPQMANTAPSESTDKSDLSSAPSEESQTSLVDSSLSRASAVVKSKLDRSTYGLLMRAHASAGDFEKALDSYTEMLDAGHKPNAFTRSALVTAYRSAESFEPLPTALLDFSDLSSDAQSKVYRAQLPGILEDKGLPGLLKLLEKMNAKQVRLDDRSVSIIAHFLSELGYFSAPNLSRLVEQLRSAHGSNFSVSDLNIILQEFIMREESSAAAALHLRRLVNLVFTPDLRETEANAAHFRKIVDKLSSQGSRPDAYTIMLIMKRYADNRGSPRTLWDFFRWQLLDQGFRPNAYHISALMVAFVNRNDPVGARKVMERGSALGVVPNLQHYSILMRYFIHVKKLAAARSLMQEARSQGLEPDIYTYAILAEHQVAGSDIGGILAIEREARMHLLEQEWPNSVLESLKYRCYIRSRRPWDAQHSLEGALDQGLVPDKHLYRLVLSFHRSNRNTYNRILGDGEEKEEARMLMEASQESKEQVKALILGQSEQISQEKEAQRANIHRLLDLLTVNREVAGDWTDETISDDLNKESAARKVKNEQV